MSQQQGDVWVYQTTDDADIEVIQGLVTMSGGLETSAYLCLFGGNEQDDGRADNPLQWWGNYGETPERQYRSETQYLLRSLPAIPANLRRVEDAATRDLSTLVDIGAATEIRVSASIPGINRLRLQVDIDGDQTLEFVENWNASR